MNALPSGGGQSDSVIVLKIMHNEGAAVRRHQWAQLHHKYWKSSNILNSTTSYRGRHPEEEHERTLNEEPTALTTGGITSTSGGPHAERPGQPERPQLKSRWRGDTDQIRLDRVGAALHA